MVQTYEKDLNIKLRKKLNTLQAMLPEFTEEFFRGISDTRQIKTRVAYAFDLRIFFHYLYSANKKFSERKDQTDFKLSDLELIDATAVSYTHLWIGLNLPHEKA